MWSRLFATQHGFTRIVLDFFPYFVSQFTAWTAIVSGQYEFAQFQESCVLLFFKRPQSGFNNRVGVGKPAAFDQGANLLFDPRTKGDGYRAPLLPLQTSKREPP